MDNKENKKALGDIDNMLYFGMLNAGVNTMSPVVPLILNIEENKEEKEKKLREWELSIFFVFNLWINLRKLIYFNNPVNESTSPSASFIIFKPPSHTLRIGF